MGQAGTVLLRQKDVSVKLLPIYVHWQKRFADRRRHSYTCCIPERRVGPKDRRKKEKIVLC